MKDDKLREKINKILDTDHVDYQPKDRTEENNLLIKRYSKMPTKKKFRIFKLASIFTSIIFVVIIGYLIINNVGDPSKPSDWEVSTIADVKSGYQELFYLSDEFQIENCELYRMDNTDKYLIITYTSDQYNLTNIIALNGYIHNDEAWYFNICDKNIEINNYLISYGYYGGDSFAVFSFNDNIYLISLLDLTDDTLLDILENIL